jgi:hypothetical protein
MKHILILAVLGFLGFNLAWAQEREPHTGPCPDPYMRSASALIVDPNYSAEELVMDFFAGSCVVPFNVSLIGNPLGMGFFQGAGTGLHLPAGILIASGNSWNAIGPNDSEYAGNGLGVPGDSGLDLLAKQTTFDATILQFDFISEVPDLAFRYVFASEEYPEYVCASFNDVFAFFVSGPGLQGPFLNNAINAAYIPGTQYPVAINSVNPGTPGSFGNVVHCYSSGSLNFSHLYLDNTGGEHVQYDGFTVPLDATFTVIPGEVYTARIAIADAGDAIFDSGVFISIESLCGDSLLQPVTSLQSSFTGKYSVSMTGKAKYAYDDWVWDMGDGTVITSTDPVSHTYNAPGLYSGRFMASNYCCTDTTSFLFPIALPPYLESDAVDWSTCHPSTTGNIRLNVLSSIGGLSYLWSDGSTQGQVRTGLAQDVYSVTVTDAEGNSAVFGPYDLHLAPLDMEVQYNAKSGKRSPVEVRISGGIPPYQYLWSDGGTGPLRDDLFQGDHTVTVTDQRGCRQERHIRLGAEAAYEGPLVLIQPNPAVGEAWVTIRESSDEVQSGELRVINAFGQVLHHQVLQTNVPTSIQLQGWPEGLYLLHFLSARHQQTRMLVVRR